VKALKTGAKFPVTKENVGAISLLARGFGSRNSSLNVPLFELLHPLI
jgi:hypothetical protein